MTVETSTFKAWQHLFARALAAEKKENFRNMKGRQYFFADFMLEHLKNFEARRQHGLQLSKLENIFNIYPSASVHERKLLLQEAQQIVQQLVPRKPQRRAGNQKIHDELQQSPSSGDWRDVPVQFVKGVGPKLGEKFAKVGVGSVGELLHYFPRKHLDYSRCARIGDLRVGDQVTIWGSIYRVSAYSPPKKKGLLILKLSVRDGTGRLEISLFQRGNAYLQRQFKARFPEGAQILMSGTVKWDKYLKGLTLDNPDFEVLGDTEGQSDESLHIGRIVPIYPLTEGLQIKWVRRAIYNALQAYQNRIQDPLPLEMRERLRLPPLAPSLREYHFPSSDNNLEAARQRLVFQELFLTQLGLQYRRKQREIHEPALVLQTEGKLARQFLEQLPFELTQAQQRVYREILSDMRSPKPMGRLVQGDVGSGKTVVAILSILEAVEAGYQAALMAPTEILAEQHFQKMFEGLLPLGIQVELFTGSQGAKQRRHARSRLASGEAAVAIGTHALIQEGVNFSNLGLVIIDEQHRFGVKQRSLLREKGLHPEILTMTATPIPRTLALSLYGDLEVSLIDELPPGRKPVDTQLIRGSQRQQVWNLIRQELDAGRQCYIVFPLVEESEKLDLKAATVEYERFQTEIFPEFEVGLLHGKMKSQEKEEIMRRFVQRELAILVSTTVIEVGVDVPNASVMVIEHAERFGLSQLHQLRGRVGRGADKAYCFLLSEKLSEQAQERLSIFTQSNDGFVIAEQDLRIRGPGEFLGTRQSGLPDLVLANLSEDTVILEAARAEAKQLIESDPELKQPAHGAVKDELFRFYRNHLSLLDA